MMRSNTAIRALTFAAVWVLSSAGLATFEARVDPLLAWERVLEIEFGLLVPGFALVVALSLWHVLASTAHPAALATRHGFDRRLAIGPFILVQTVFAAVTIALSLLVARVLCHSLGETTFNRDLLVCCGIGCLATAAYIAVFLAATRLGVGRAGAWTALGLDLTLGHINGGPALFVPHRFVANLVGHPAALSTSAHASSWILLGFVAAGLGWVLLRTPS
ncbi:MAG TPA: hypothetical protein VIV60_21495 [Polyangiaceae bacterium]